jgi:hypothetical protein
MNDRPIRPTLPTPLTPAAIHEAVQQLNRNVGWARLHRPTLGHISLDGYTVPCEAVAVLNEPPTYLVQVTGGVLRKGSADVFAFRRGETMFVAAGEFVVAQQAGSTAQPEKHSKNRYEQQAYEIAGPDSEEAVRAVAEALHRGESMHTHAEYQSPEPCSYCWLRAGRAVRALRELMGYDANVRARSEQEGS